MECLDSTLLLEEEYVEEVIKEAPPTKGVTFHRQSRSWRAETLVDGRKKYRYFSVRKFGGDAWRRAVTARQEWEVVQQQQRALEAAMRGSTEETADLGADASNPEESSGSLQLGGGTVTDPNAGPPVVDGSSWLSPSCVKGASPAHSPSLQQHQHPQQQHQEPDHLHHFPGTVREDVAGRCENDSLNYYQPGHQQTHSSCDGPAPSEGRQQLPNCFHGEEVGRREEGSSLWGTDGYCKGVAAGGADRGHCSDGGCRAVGRGCHRGRTAAGGGEVGERAPRDGATIPPDGCCDSNDASNAYPLLWCQQGGPGSRSSLVETSASGSHTSEGSDGEGAEVSECDATPPSPDGSKHAPSLASSPREHGWPHMSVSPLEPPVMGSCGSARRRWEKERQPFCAPPSGFASSLDRMCFEEDLFLVPSTASCRQPASPHFSSPHPLSPPHPMSSPHPLSSPPPPSSPPTGLSFCHDDLVCSADLMPYDAYLRRPWHSDMSEDSLPLGAEEMPRFLLGQSEEGDALCMEPGRGSFGGLVAASPQTGRVVVRAQMMATSRGPSHSFCDDAVGGCPAAAGDAGRHGAPPQPRARRKLPLGRATTHSREGGFHDNDAASSSPSWGGGAVDTSPTGAVISSLASATSALALAHLHHDEWRGSGWSSSTYVMGTGELSLVSAGSSASGIPPCVTDPPFCLPSCSCGDEPSAPCDDAAFQGGVPQSVGEQQTSYTVSPASSSTSSRPQSPFGMPFSPPSNGPASSSNPLNNSASTLPLSTAATPPSITELELFHDQSQQQQQSLVPSREAKAVASHSPSLHEDDASSCGWHFQQTDSCFQSTNGEAMGSSDDSREHAEVAAGSVSSDVPSGGCRQPAENRTDGREGLFVDFVKEEEQRQGGGGNGGGVLHSYSSSTGRDDCPLSPPSGCIAAPSFPFPSSAGGMPHGPSSSLSPPSSPSISYSLAHRAPAASPVCHSSVCVPTASSATALTATTNVSACAASISLDASSSVSRPSSLSFGATATGRGGRLTEGRRRKERYVGHNLSAWRRGGKSGANASALVMEAVLESTVSLPQGVCFCPQSGVWQASVNLRGRRRKRRFSVSKYGHSEARRQAIRCRMMWNRMLADGRDSMVFDALGDDRLELEEAQVGVGFSGLPADDIIDSSLHLPRGVKVEEGVHVMDATACGGNELGM